MDNLFSRYYKKYDAWYDRNKFAYLSEVAALKKVLPKRGKGLEIGVGTGRFASALGIEHGVDPSGKMLKIARDRGVDARVGCGERLPFKSNTFDYAAIIITLCFVRDPEKVLREAARVLKKKGKIILAIVDKESFLGKFYRKKKSAFYKEANFFSPEEVEELLRSSGFNRVSYHQTIFGMPDKMTSIDVPEKGFGRGGFVVISGRRK